jgi:hypothetical protein
MMVLRTGRGVCTDTSVIHTILHTHTHTHTHTHAHIYIHISHQGGVCVDSGSLMSLMVDKFPAATEKGEEGVAA